MDDIQADPHRSTSAVSLVGQCLLLGLLTAVVWHQPATAQEPILSPVPVDSLPLTASRASGQNVSRVKIEGNRTVREAKVFQQLQTRPGLPFNPEVAADDVRRLVSQLKFISVRTSLEEDAEGIVVTYHVVERPRLEAVEYIGNYHVKAKQLQKETGLEPDSTLDLSQISDARRKIEELYRSKGYNHVEVTIREGDSPDDRKAVFVIHEGPLQKVSEVNFVGNTIVSSARLRTILDTKTPKFFFIGGQLKPETLDADMDKLVSYYHALGYWDIRVGREVKFDAAQGWAAVTFVIDEGVRFTMRNMTIVGNRKFTTEEISQALKMKEGDFFQQTTLQQDVQALKDLYGSKGYIYCDVQADCFCPS